MVVELAPISSSPHFHAPKENDNCNVPSAIQAIVIVLIVTIVMLQENHVLFSL
jgi:hypothetical protein